MKCILIFQCGDSSPLSRLCISAGRLLSHGQGATETWKIVIKFWKYYHSYIHDVKLQLSFMVIRQLGPTLWPLDEVRWSHWWWTRQVKRRRSRGGEVSSWGVGLPKLRLLRFSFYLLWFFKYSFTSFCHPTSLITNRQSPITNSWGVGSLKQRLQRFSFNFLSFSKTSFTSFCNPVSPMIITISGVGTLWGGRRHIARPCSSCRPYSSCKVGQLSLNFHSYYHIVFVFLLYLYCTALF